MAIAGMTLWQVAQLIGALAGAAKDIQSIHDDLTAKGLKPADMIPVDHALAIGAAVDKLSDTEWAEDHSN